MQNNSLDKNIYKIVKDFINRYKLSFNEIKDSEYLKLEELMNSILTATLKTNEEELKKYCKKLAKFNFDNNIPYVILINELNSLKNFLTNELLERNAKDEIFQLQLVYNDIENVVALEHLNNYMNKLVHANNIRINSLKDLMKKNLIIHYQDHLEWLNALTKAIKNKDIKKIPELESEHCQFGKWLKDKGKNIISNNSKYKHITNIHKNLHSLAVAISQQIDKKFINFNILMSYLEKCEFISLAIGTELALIDNRLLINDSSKDKMTGALNRNSLENIFINQYELSLATNTTFVLAICDLDHFKFLNDSYGHVAGDYVLKEFVKTCKNSLRESDIIIRYEGEEFLIILSNSNLINSEEKLNQIRKNFNNLCCSYNNKHLNVSVSIGAISISPKQYIKKSNIDVLEYIDLADKKLYEAKNSGRNKVVI